MILLNVFFSTSFLSYVVLKKYQEKSYRGLYKLKKTMVETRKIFD